jgi:hypothetical protein
MIIGPVVSWPAAMSGLLFLRSERLQDSVNKEDIHRRAFPWLGYR